jgi:hypothetical protein
LFAKFNETGSVRDTPRRPGISDDTKLNLLLFLEDNPHGSTTEVALQKVLVSGLWKSFKKKEKLHPYKAKFNSFMSSQKMIRTDVWNFVKSS